MSVPVLKLLGPGRFQISNLRKFQAKYLDYWLRTSEVQDAAKFKTFKNTLSLRTLSASLGISSIVLFLSLYVSLEVLSYVHYGNWLWIFIVIIMSCYGVIVIELDKLSQRRECEGRRLCCWKHQKSLRLSHLGLIYSNVVPRVEISTRWSLPSFTAWVGCAGGFLLISLSETFMTVGFIYPALCSQYESVIEFILFIQPFSCN